MIIVGLLYFTYVKLKSISLYYFGELKIPCSYTFLKASLIIRFLGIC